jgi:hypothetical protein
MAGSTRLSFTRGAVTPTVPALVSTSRDPTRAITHRQPATVGVALISEPGEVDIHLRLQRLGQHPTSALAHDLIEQRQPTSRAIIASSRVSDHGEHGRTFPRRRANAAPDQNYYGFQTLLGKVRPFTSPRREPSTGSDHCSRHIAQALAPRTRCTGHRAMQVLEVLRRQADRVFRSSSVVGALRAFETMLLFPAMLASKPLGAWLELRAPSRIPSPLRFDIAAKTFGHLWPCG